MPYLRAHQLASFGCAVALASHSITGCSPAAPTAPNAEDAGGADVTTSGEPDAAPKPNALATAVDSLFTQADTDKKFAGSIVVVDDGKVVLEKAYGLADPKGTRVNETSSVYRIGSISKQFTAAAILKLAEQGKLAITDPVSKYFPDYPPANLTMGGVEVTLHHLLSQTSGLPDPAAVPSVSAQFWFDPIAPTAQVAAVSAKPLLFKPGSKHAYLNFNYLMLGLVVEKASGQNYEDYLRANLWNPSGMQVTGTLLPAGLASQASIGSSTKTGKLYVLANVPSFKDRNLTLAFGAGQVYSTAADLAKWDRALDTDSVLSAASRKLLFTPNLDDYAYGWVHQVQSGVAYDWHNGALSPLGFSAYMVRVPAKKRFVAYLSNFDIERTQSLEVEVETLVTQ
jgi:CubicO group peptidase (beta-lactamase class C family)